MNKIFTFALLLFLVGCGHDKERISLEKREIVDTDACGHTSKVKSINKVKRTVD